MAKGFDDIKNGLALGAAFGLFVYYVASQPGAASWYSWVATMANSASVWLVSQTWMSWASSFADKMGYVIAALIGAGIGGYIDSK